MMYTPAEMFQLICEGHHTLNLEKLNAHVQPLEEADVVTAERKVNDELSRKRDSMREEVKQLASHALSIEDSFDKILRGLEDANNKENMPRDLATDVAKLIEEWKTHLKTFRAHIWKSRDVAGKARIAAEDFAEVFTKKVLMNSNMSISEMKNAIHEYSETLDADTKKAQDVVDGFRDLAKDVNAFASRWEQIVKRHKVELNTTIIRHLDKEIAKVASKLKTYQMAIDTISTAVGIFSLASNALSVISSICPSGWHRSAATFPAPHSVHGPLKKASIKRGEKERKLEKLKEQRQRKAAELESLDALDARLNESKENFETITMRLGKFAAVWGVIQADLRATEEYLTKAEATTTDKPFQRAMFDARLNSAREIYIVLSDILGEYQGAVDAECKLFSGHAEL